jgi:RNA polymerase sigma factor (sigma-70 family)
MGESHLRRDSTSSRVVRNKPKAPAGASFESFFSVESERLVRAMYLMTGDRQEAEDLSQDAMLRVYERWADVSEMASPAGYLYTVALNLHRRRLRRVFRSLSTSSKPSEDSITTLDEAVVLLHDVRSALQSMTRPHREVVVLREWLGLTADEIAKIVGTSPASVRVRLHRARALLRQRLGGSYG